MDESVKRRVTGAAVLALAAALLLPWLFGDPQNPRGEIRPSFSSPPLSTPRVRFAPSTPAPTVRPAEPVAEPAPPPPTPASARWILQLASYTDTAAAERFLQTLRGDGHDAYRESVNVDGRTFHRVRLRLTGDRSEATRLKTRLEKEFRLTAQLYPAR